MDLNSTVVASGGTVAAQITLFNSLDQNLSLAPSFPENSTIQSWNAYDFLCGENNLLPMIGYALFQGDYTPDNISLAGSPLQLAPFVELPCAIWPNPTSIVFLPKNDTAEIYGTGGPSGVVEPISIGASTESCTWNGSGGDCGVGEGLSGYWNSTSPITQQEATTASPFFRYFAPGEYTLAVQDVWNQTIYAHFQVVSAIIRPVEVVSVTGPIPPYNPGGPVVSVTLKNIDHATIAALEATLGVENLENGVHGYSFVFNASPSDLLLPGQTIEETHTLIGAGFDTGVDYPLLINGTTGNGTQFSYTVQVQVVPPIVSASSTSSVSSTTSGGTTQTRATVTDSIDNMELRLSLNTSSSPSGVSTSVFVDEYNPLAAANNVTAANDWFALLNYLNGAPCGDDGPPISFAIAEGYYTSSNVTAAKFLDLVNPGVIYYCPLYLGYANPTWYLFQPTSDMAASYGCNQKGCISGSMSTGLTSSSWGAVTGYWNQGGTFTSFPRGVYTVLAEDEWGNSVLAYFTVS